LWGRGRHEYVLNGSRRKSGVLIRKSRTCPRGCMQSHVLPCARNFYWQLPKAPTCNAKYVIGRAVIFAYSSVKSILCYLLGPEAYFDIFGIKDLMITHLIIIKCFIELTLGATLPEPKQIRASKQMTAASRAIRIQAFSTFNHHIEHESKPSITSVDGKCESLSAF
jgi:hypothetical protein